MFKAKHMDIINIFSYLGFSENQLSNFHYKHVECFVTIPMHYTLVLDGQFISVCLGTQCICPPWVHYHMYHSLLKS